MNTCRMCKKEFEDNDLYKSFRKYKQKVYKYFTCRTCNTDSCKKYRKTPSGKKKFKDIQNRQNKKFNLKVNCRSITNYAIRTGRLVRPNNCSSCRLDKKLDAHHDDYLKPLKVTWLCRLCHKRHHKNKML